MALSQTVPVVRAVCAIEHVSFSRDDEGVRPDPDSRFIPDAGPLPLREFTPASS
jgi:hypothetical protein